MSKKMTAKEFKKVLADAEIDFEVYGYEGVLNLIALANIYLEDETNYENLKQMYARRRNAINNVLEEKGFFNN